MKSEKIVKIIEQSEFIRKLGEMEKIFEEMDLSDLKIDSDNGQENKTDGNGEKPPEKKNDEMPQESDKKDASEKDDLVVSEDQIEEFVKKMSEDERKIVQDALDLIKKYSKDEPVEKDSSDNSEKEEKEDKKQDG
jgi:hypothetical protein